MDVLQLLESSQLFMIIASGALGLVVGSFLNVVVHRVPIMLQKIWTRECREHLEPGAQQPADTYNLVTPGSRCPECDHRIGVLENIPVLSYLFLRGRCSGCGTSISLRYPAVEITTAILSVITALHFGYSVQTLAALAFTWTLIPLFLIDFDTQFLPDTITLPVSAGHDHPATALGGPASQPFQRLYRQPDQYHWCGCRLPFTLDHIPGLQAGHR